jgi:hypothetical protein
MRWNLMVCNRLWFSLCTVLQTGSAQNVEYSPLFFSPVLQFGAFCILISTFEATSQ